MVMLGATNVQSEDDIQGNARPLGRYHAIVKEGRRRRMTRSSSSSGLGWHDARPEGTVVTGISPSRGDPG